MPRGLTLGLLGGLGRAGPRRRCPAASAAPLVEIGSLPHRDRSTSAPRSVRGGMPAASAGPESANLMTDSGRGRRSSHALLSRPAVSNVAGIGVIPRFRGASRAARRAEGVWNDRCPRCSDAQLAPGQRLEPISTRNRTDLDAEPDRSRRGTRPISVRGAGLRPCPASPGSVPAQFRSRPTPPALSPRGLLWQAQSHGRS